MSEWTHAERKALKEFERAQVWHLQMAIFEAVWDRRGRRRIADLLARLARLTGRAMDFPTSNYPRDIAKLATAYDGATADVRA